MEWGSILKDYTTVNINFVMQILFYYLECSIGAAVSVTVILDNLLRLLAHACV